MALDAYLTLDGTKQGVIKGPCTLPGREDSIVVVETTHELSTPVDSVSGQASGKRIHKPLKIVKAVDRSSPKLFQALVTSETLKTVKLRFWAPGSQAGTVAATEVHYFTITLTNAHIRNIQFSQPSRWDPNLRNVPDHEEISFTYGRIQWETLGPHGSIAVDDWLR